MRKAKLKCETPLYLLVDETETEIHGTAFSKESIKACQWMAEDIEKKKLKIVKTKTIIASISYV